MSWQMFGHPAGNGSWYALGDEWYVRAHGATVPIPVTVTEDLAGDHLGWIDAGDELEGNDTPTMIHRKEIFNIQFPYGYEEEEKRGRGRAVPLTIKENTE